MRQERSWSTGKQKKDHQKVPTESHIDQQQQRSQSPTTTTTSSSSVDKHQQQQHKKLRLKIMEQQQQQHSSSMSTTLPPATRVKLYELFVQIEREFELLYAENIQLQERLEQANNRQQQQQQHYYQQDDSESLASASMQQQLQQQPPQQQQQQQHHHQVRFHTSKGMHKLRSHTSKLRAQTNKLMSNLKSGQQSSSSIVNLNCTPVRRYVGHKDGIWEVSVSRMGLPILGTASADHTAMIWGMHSGQALLHYTGHSGSVNSLRFHPKKELVLTASGDGTVHIWQCAVHLYNESSSGRVASSEDELEPHEVAGGGGHGKHHHHHHQVVDSMDEEQQFSVLRTPLRSLQGHNGVAIAADWLPNGDQAVTAGWDKLACIWDTQTGELLQQLSGHDEELTHAAAHPTSRLVVTSSKDCTFRLWDFRESIHSVSVFQGHQDSVTSAVFTPDSTHQVVSGSDDRTARIWDLRNMRTPVAVIQSDSSVNRLSVSQVQCICLFLYPTSRFAANRSSIYFNLTRN